MFAYCGNNPANYSDPSGCRPSWEHNYGNGIVGYTDTGTGGDYIKNQNDPSVSNQPFGISNIMHSGCGVVAVYNALISLGNYHSFSSILEYFNSTGSMNIFGLAGMMPWHVGQYFEALGYKVAYFDGMPFGYFDDELFDAVVAGADAVIISYLFSTESNIFGIGGHFAEIHKSGSGYTAYNVYSNITSPVFFQSPALFAFNNTNFYAVIICIYRRG